MNKIVVRWAENVGRLPIEKRLAEERAAKRAEEERLKQEQWVRRQRLQLEFTDRQRVEREQAEKLKALAARWHESRQIRAYIAAVAGQATVQEGNRTEWCEWAMKQADRLDPLVEAQPSILDMSFEQYERLQVRQADSNI
ncbi:MAG: hypothetical protein JNK76_20475 [Planctomycetales bacterium]|nr:hypothetical protein [Planctomycetales bacterium]